MNNLLDPPDALQVREWSEKITRATARCKLVASNEDVWGYTASAQAYRDMADEIDAVKWWVMAQYGPPKEMKKTECSGV